MTEILKELNGIANKLESAYENENWDSVDHIHDELSELIYKLSDFDFLSEHFEN